LVFHTQSAFSRTRLKVQLAKAYTGMRQRIEALQFCNAAASRHLYFSNFLSVIVLLISEINIGFTISYHL
jgi:hypothetical protein